MTLGSVNKLGKRNTTTSKKFDDDVVKFRRHRYFSNSWLNWSNPEPEFRTRDLQFLHYH